MSNRPPRWWQRGREYPLNIFELCIIDIMGDSLLSDLQVWKSPRKYRLSQICHLLVEQEIKICCPKESCLPLQPPEFCRMRVYYRNLDCKARNCERTGTAWFAWVFLGSAWITVVTNWLELVPQLGPVQTHLQILQCFIMSREIDRKRYEPVVGIWKRSITVGGMSKQKSGLSKATFVRGLDPLHLGDYFPPAPANTAIRVAALAISKAF